ncbi:hypothetical protein HPULCUR_004411 [Helicostylum pulchrum]|uniref:Uncharacterized protein n=1 Tax=Helicostylum pulchrum TaxID=562976 RepID=A0ABP9XW46_9FUNG
MSHFQQVYTAQPSPAVMMNSPQPYGYNYPQHPSMQSYYPSPHPMQQPSGFMPPNQGQGGSGCLECCFALL